MTGRLLDATNRSDRIQHDPRSKSHAGTQVTTVTGLRKNAPADGAGLAAAGFGDLSVK